MKKEKKCEHENIEEVEFCSMCGGSVGVCTDCDIGFHKESPDLEWIEE